MDLELGGKKAVITGGSRGIGKSIAMSLAKEGVEVSICSRSMEALKSTSREIELETSQKVFFSEELEKVLFHSKISSKIFCNFVTLKSAVKHFEIFF